MPREILHAVWVATLNRRGQETQTASVTRRKSNLPRFSLRPPGFVVVVVIVAAATLLLLLLLLLLLSPVGNRQLRPHSLNCGFNVFFLPPPPPSFPT